LLVEEDPENGATIGRIAEAWGRRALAAAAAIAPALGSEAIGAEVRARHEAWIESLGLSAKVAA
jgi:hypothetical protein